MEVETKPTHEEEIYSEVKHLRAELQKLKEEFSVQTVTREKIKEVVGCAHLDTRLDQEQVEQLTDALYPLLKGLDITNKTLVFEIPMNGTIPDDLLQRYCAYVDLLKLMGAKQVVFVSKETKLECLSDKDLERYGLRRI